MVQKLLTSNYLLLVNAENYNMSGKFECFERGMI
jgi:hypothetical protein